MSVHPTEQTTGLPSTAAPAEPSEKRLVILSPEQAGRWLQFLRGCNGAGGSSPTCLKQLGSALADAQWLARWNRESAKLELCPTLQTEIFAELLRLGQETEAARDFDVLEEMLVMLCIDRRS